MSDISGIKRLIDLAMARGLGREWLSAEHDVIYLPFFEKRDAELLELKKSAGLVGLHFDDEVGSWAMFT